MQDQHLDIRIGIRITKQNRDTLQAQADDEGHNNISRVVRALIEDHCSGRRRGHHGHKSGRRSRP